MFVFSYFSAISFVVFLVAALSTVYSKRKSIIHQHFALLLFCISVWCLANYQADTALTEAALLDWSNLALAAAFFGSSFHISFSYAFRGQSPWRYWGLFLLPSLVATVLLFFGIGGYTDPFGSSRLPAQIQPNRFGGRDVPRTPPPIAPTSDTRVAAGGRTTGARNRPAE